jgi:AraC-like DNA-binding protein
MNLAYRQFAPPDHLQSLVRCVWTLHGETTGEAQPQPIIPDGSIEIIFNLSQPFRQLTPSGDTVLQPRLMIVGPTGIATVAAPTGAVDVVGVRLQPWAGHVFGMPPAEFRDMTIPMDLLAPGLARLADTRLRESLSQSKRVTLVLEGLERLAARSTPAPGRVQAAVAHCSQPGMVRSAQIAKLLGYSLRSLERHFANHVGLSPKRLATVFRIQRVFRILRMQPASTWTSIAGQAGFADQSHLIRDMRRVAGLAPTELHESSRILTRLFAIPH